MLSFLFDPCAPASYTVPRTLPSLSLLALWPQIEMQKLEGELLAIGASDLTESRFSHFQRDVHLLQPPQVDLAVRAQIVEKSAVQLLRLMGLTDDPPAGGADGADLENPQARAGGGGGERDQADLSPRGPPSARPQEPASVLRRLFEAQVKYVGQRALWREAVRRHNLAQVAAEEGNGPGPGPGTGARSTAPTAPLPVIFDLLAEGVATGLEAVPSLRQRMPSLAGIELPPALRHAVWSAALVTVPVLQQNEARLRASHFAGAYGGVGGRSRHYHAGRVGGAGAVGAADGTDGERFAVLQLAHRMLSRGMASFQGAGGAGSMSTEELEIRACALVVQLHACGSGELPTAAGSLALPLAYVLPQTADAEALAYSAASQAVEDTASRAGGGRGAKRVTFTAGAGGAGSKQGRESPTRRALPAALSRSTLSTHALLAAHVPEAQLPSALKAVADAKARAGTARVEESSMRRAADRPAEPAAVTMLMKIASQGVKQAVATATDDAKGVWPLLEKRWPRLLKHLLSICQRDDLADVSARQAGKQPPRAMLHRIVAEEWLEHGFVGSLPRDALLFCWDQFMLQGWDMSTELVAACLFLMRREVRRLDQAAAGATELRGAMRAQLHTDMNVCELQVLVAGVSAETRRKSSAVAGYKLGGNRGLGATVSGTKVDDWDNAPQVMLRLPIIRPLQEQEQAQGHGE